MPQMLPLPSPRRLGGTILALTSLVVGAACGEKGAVTGSGGISGGQGGAVSLGSTGGAGGGAAGSGGGGAGARGGSGIAGAGAAGSVGAAGGRAGQDGAGRAGEGGAGRAGQAGQAGQGGGALGGAGGSPIFSPPACGAALPAYTGTLCGPASLPCQTLVDETVETTAVFRNRQPAIATDSHGQPQMMYYRADGGYTGIWSSRSAAGAWQSEPFPIAVASSSLVVGADGLPVALVNSGVLPGTSLWRRQNAGWTRLDGADLGGYESYDAGALVATKDGCFHAGLLADEDGAADQPGYALWNGRWNLSSFGPSFIGGIPAAVALATDGTPYVAFWHYSSQPAGGLYLSFGGHASELVDHGDGTQDWPTRPFITVAAGGDGQPLAHVLYRAVGPAVAGTAALPHVLIEAERGASGSWTRRTIATASGKTVADCPAPTRTSASCLVDTTDVTPVAILGTREGNIRVVYTAERMTATLASVCMGGLDGAMTTCSYQAQMLTYDSELRLAWSNDDGSIGQTVVTRTKVAGQGQLAASATLDVQGRIHVGLFDGVADTVVRYVLVGGS